PSWTSIARRTLPSRLELKSPAGSGSAAPLAKVIFTTFLYDSPVQISPSCDQTGLLHFHSSTTPGSASLIRARKRASVSPRQSPSSRILASIRPAADSVGFDWLFFMFTAPRRWFQKRTILGPRRASASWSKWRRSSQSRHGCLVRGLEGPAAQQRDLLQREIHRAVVLCVPAGAGRGHAGERWVRAAALLSLRRGRLVHREARGHARACAARGRHHPVPPWRCPHDGLVRNGRARADARCAGAPARAARRIAVGRRRGGDPH